MVVRAVFSVHFPPANYCLTRPLCLWQSLGMDGRQLLAQHLSPKGAQAQLAREVECSESHLSLFLKGERELSPTLAKKISAETGISAGKLLGLDEAAA